MRNSSRLTRSHWSSLLQLFPLTSSKTSTKTLSFQSLNAAHMWCLTCQSLNKTDVYSWRMTIYKSTFSSNKHNHSAISRTSANLKNMERQSWIVVAGLQRRNLCIKQSSMLCHFPSLTVSLTKQYPFIYVALCFPRFSASSPPTTSY